MADREWRFLLDENIAPSVAKFLQKEGYRADHVPAVLGKGADDIEDVLPYARDRDLIIVTQDVSDFSGLDRTDHCGLVLVYEQRTSAFEIATGLMDIADAYGSREQFVAEALDDWLS